MRGRVHDFSRRRIARLLLCLLLLAACATPVGVKRVDRRRVPRTLTSNVRSQGRLSAPTQDVWLQRGLVEYGRRAHMDGVDSEQAVRSGDSC